VLAVELFYGDSWEQLLVNSLQSSLTDLCQELRPVLHMFMGPFNSQRREATSLDVNCLFAPVICVEERLVVPLASDVSPSSSLILVREHCPPLRKWLESVRLKL